MSDLAEKYHLSDEEGISFDARETIMAIVSKKSPGFFTQLKLPAKKGHFVKDLPKEFFDDLDMVWMESDMLPGYSCGVQLSQVSRFMHDPNDHERIMLFGNDGRGIHFPVAVKEFYTAMAPHMVMFEVEARLFNQPTRPNQRPSALSAAKNNT